MVTILCFNLSIPNNCELKTICTTRFNISLSKWEWMSGKVSTQITDLKTHILHISITLPYLVRNFLFGPNYENVMEDIIERSWNPVVIHVDSMQHACSIFNIEDLRACKFYSNRKLYCACSKIHFDFTQGPILGSIYGYIIEEKETKNGKQWTLSLTYGNQIKMLAPQFDQVTQQYVFQQVYK